MTNPPKPRVVCFGEVLWDRFPSGDKMGGAPFNVAFRLQSLGIAAAMASAVGKDLAGDELMRRATASGIQTSLIQTCIEAETGWVQVALDTDGVATYVIGEPVAWDFITPTDALLEAVSGCEALVFGSLIGRSQLSKQTLDLLFSRAKFRVFDVNLRPPHFTFPAVIAWMHLADMVKCNEEEFAQIAQEIGVSSGSWAERMGHVAATLGLRYLVVTRGDQGALVQAEGEFYEHPGYPISVVDTVGAGDAFTATFLEGILTGRSAAESLDRACAMGALIAGSEGATAEVTPSLLEAFIAQHNH
jgi:fructokinase